MNTMWVSHKLLVIYLSENKFVKVIFIKNILFFLIFNSIIKINYKIIYLYFTFFQVYITYTIYNIII